MACPQVSPAGWNDNPDVQESRKDIPQIARRLRRACGRILSPRLCNHLSHIKLFPMESKQQSIQSQKLDCQELSKNVLIAAASFKTALHPPGSIRTWFRRIQLGDAAFSEEGRRSCLFLRFSESILYRISPIGETSPSVHLLNHYFSAAYHWSRDCHVMGCGSFQEREDARERRGS